jgi:hypothetical protein
MKDLVWIASIMAKIQTKPFQKTGVERYHYTIVFSHYTYGPIAVPPKK